jgi:hypothetical protein
MPVNTRTIGQYPKRTTVISDDKFLLQANDGTYYHATANQIDQPIIIKKTSDLVLTEDTIDPELQFPLGANEVWKINIYTKSSNNIGSTGDITAPVGTETFNDRGGTNVLSEDLSVEVLTQADKFAKTESIIKVGSTAGTFTILFFRELSDWTLSKDTFMMLWKVA